MTPNSIPRSVVLAVDPSRSTPDDALTPPAVSPEAAPPRATTWVKCFSCGREQSPHEKWPTCAFCGYLWNAPTDEQLRASLAPSRESGALLDEMDARIREIDDRLRLHRATDCPMSGEEDCCDTLVIELRTLRRYHAGFSTLERDAARMREALEFYADPASWVTTSHGFAAQYDPVPPPAVHELGTRARAALRSPTPEGPQE